MPILNRRHLLRTGAAFLAAPALITRAMAAGHAKHPIAIEGFAFAPETLEMTAGDFVVFTNMDGAPHTATADNGFFDTGRLNRGDSGEIHMTEAGEFSYFCKFHPNMKGLIRVS